MIFLLKYWKQLAAAALAVGLFASGWLANGWRMERNFLQLQTQLAENRAEFQKQAREKEKEYAEQLRIANENASKRENNLRISANRASNAANRLRNELDALRKDLPGLSKDACCKRAESVSIILGYCINEYRVMGEDAGRVENERQKLIDAWPK